MSGFDYTYAFITMPGVVKVGGSTTFSGARSRVTSINGYLPVDVLHCCLLGIWKKPALVDCAEIKAHVALSGAGFRHLGREIFKGSPKEMFEVLKQEFGEPKLGPTFGRYNEWLHRALGYSPVRQKVPDIVVVKEIMSLVKELFKDISFANWKGRRDYPEWIEYDMYHKLWAKAQWKKFIKGIPKRYRSIVAFQTKNFDVNGMNEYVLRHDVKGITQWDEILSEFLLCVSPIINAPQTVQRRPDEFSNRWEKCHENLEKNGLLRSSDGSWNDANYPSLTVQVWYSSLFLTITGPNIHTVVNGVFSLPVRVAAWRARKLAGLADSPYPNREKSPKPRTDHTLYSIAHYQKKLKRIINQ